LDHDVKSLPLQYQLVIQQKKNVTWGIVRALKFFLQIPIHIDIILYFVLQKM
jgi:hypothetical protein